MLEHTLRWLRGKGVLFGAVAFACVLCAPALLGGFVADDFAHRKYALAHLHSADAPGAWWNMFDVYGRGPKIPVLVFLGVLPWWSSPQLRIAFLRPLAAASHYLDFLLWPDAAWLMHLHNIALYGAIVWLVGLLYRRLLGARSLAGFALLLYAVDEAHAQGSAWLSARNTLLTAFFVLLTLLLFDRGRRDGTRWAAWLAAPMLLCAHASSEGAIAIWAYLVGYAVWLDRGTARERALSLVPFAGVTLTWVVLSAAFGFGTRDSGVYVDPRSDPLFFLQVTAERLPEVLRAQFTLPFELVHKLSASAQSVIAFASYAFLLLCTVVGLPQIWRRPTVRYFAFGTIGSALAVCAGTPEPRLLFLVGFGAHALVAELVAGSVHAWSTAAPRRALHAFMVGVWLSLHGPVAVAVAPLAPLTWRAVDAKLRRAAATLPSGPQLERSVILVLNTASFLTAVFAGSYRLESGKAGPPMMHILGSSATPVRMTRLARNTIELEPEGGYLVEPTSQLVRQPNRRFAVGDAIFLYGPRITIAQITHDGRPKRIRADLIDAEDARMLWVTWNDRRQRFDRVTLPPVGASLTLQGSTDPLTMQ